MELSAQGFEKEHQAKHQEQCSSSESYCMNAPGRERRGFRYTDIDHKWIVAQRMYSNQTSFTVEIARRSILPTTLQNELVPRRRCWHLIVHATFRVRVTHDDGAVAVQQYKRLIGQGCDRFIDLLEIGEPDSG